MAQQLGGLAVLADDLGVVPRTHMGVEPTIASCSKESYTLLWPPQAMQAYIQKKNYI